MAKPIQAEIVGGRVECGAFAAPTVRELCRALLSANVDPQRPLEVYRRKELVHQVPSIAEAAGVKVRVPEWRPR